MKDLTELKAKIEALPEEERIYSEPPGLVRICTAADLQLFNQQHTDLERRLAEMQKPLDVVLFCPSCKTQHIDAPEPNQEFWLVERIGAEGEIHCHEDVSGRHLWWGGTFGNWQTDVNKVPLEARFPSKEAAQTAITKASSSRGDELIFEACRIEEHAILGWSNPPHKSHLCHNCGCIWRPADVPTNGVAQAKTVGDNDTPLAAFSAIKGER